MKFGEVFVDGNPENLVGHVESGHLHDGPSKHGGHDGPSSYQNSPAIDEPFKSEGQKGSESDQPLKKVDANGSSRVKKDVVILL